MDWKENFHRNVDCYFPSEFICDRKETLNQAISFIQEDLVKQISYFGKEGRLTEAERIKQRTEFDLEMMRELGYCSGIENYSRYFDQRKPGQRPFVYWTFSQMIS